MQHLNHLVTCPIKIRGVFRVDRTPEPSDQKLHCLDVTSVGRSPNWAIKTKNLEVDVRLPGIEPGFPRQNLVITHCWIIWKWQREVLAIGQQTLLFWIGWRLDFIIFINWFFQMDWVCSSFSALLYPWWCWMWFDFEWIQGGGVWEWNWQAARSGPPPPD